MRLAAKTLGLALPSWPQHRWRIGLIRPRSTRRNLFDYVDPPQLLTEARQAYRRTAQRAHPDHGGSNEEMALVGQAWRWLEGKLKAKNRTGSVFELATRQSDPEVLRRPVLVPKVGGRMIEKKSRVQSCPLCGASLPSRDLCRECQTLSEALK